MVPTPRRNGLQEITYRTEVNIKLNTLLNEYLENGGDIQEFSKNPGRFTKGAFLDFRYLVVRCLVYLFYLQ